MLVKHIEPPRLDVTSHSIHTLKIKNWIFFVFLIGFQKWFFSVQSLLYLPLSILFIFLSYTLLHTHTLTTLTVFVCLRVYSFRFVCVSISFVIIRQCTHSDWWRLTLDYTFQCMRGNNIPCDVCWMPVSIERVSSTHYSLWWMAWKWRPSTHS